MCYGYREVKSSNCMRSAVFHCRSTGKFCAIGIEDKRVNFLLILQTFAYSILWDLQFLFRNLALIGALLLVLAESRGEAKSLFAGVPSLGDNKPKNYLQLTGRILLAFMFITLIRFELTFLQVRSNIL